MKSRLVDQFGCDEAQAAQRLDTRGDSQQRARTAAIETLAGGEHRRHHHRARVHRAAFEGVVEILAVRGGAVQQRRIFRPVAARVADRRAAAAGIHALFHRAYVVALARRDAQARDVEQQVLAAGAHGRGNILFLQALDFPDKNLGNGIHYMYPPPLTCSVSPVM